MDKAFPDSKNITLFARMADLIGDEAALKVREEFGGLVLPIPKIDSVHRKQRDDKICAEYDAGASVSQLARRYRLTVRRIYGILNEAGPANTRNTTLKKEE
jgi:Mor family transcriptional regulator